MNSCIENLFTTLSILFTVTGCTSLVKYHENEVDGQSDKIIIPFIIHVANRHMNDKTGITVISTHSMDAQIVNGILRSVNNNSLRNGIYFFSGQSFEEVPQTTINIVLFNSYNEKFLNQFYRKNIFNVRSTIILVSMDSQKVTILKALLKNLWKKNYINVVATFIEGNELYFFTYNAYSETFRELRSSDYHKSIFEEKTRNLFKNPINVLFTFNDHTKIRKVREYEGIYQKYEGKDYDIIKTIFDHLNANLTIIDIDDVISDPVDNPWFSNLDLENKTEVQRDILRKWNITMLSKSQRVLDKDGVIEVTYPHTDNAVTLLVPKHQKVTKPVEVYNYLTQPVWLVHLLIFTVLAIFLTIMRKSSGMSCRSLEPSKHLFRIMLTCSTHGFCRKPFEELFILAWIIWCFLASIMAQAKITSMLSTDLYESELDSLEDIYRRREMDFFIFGLNSYIDEISEKYEGSKYMKIISEMVKVPVDENLGEMMLLEIPKPNAFKMSILLEHDIAKFYARHIRNRRDGSGRPLLHLMKHSIMPCFQVFHVTQDSPLLPTIDKKIRQLVEGGLIDLFKDRHLFKGLIDGYLFPDEEYDIDTYEPTPINMELAKHAFFLLNVGLVTSAIIFIIEMFVYGLERALQADKFRNYVNIKKVLKK